ncbi:RadC family protein [Dickeya zeae]|uniref:RadC family protein n=1 Tax=Dickeya zeae TaxID=204042 RepID=UPI001F332B16|nr:DNA repair protein RadC [Dickeya zeae]UJR63004.1 DNA repair protein RadC [Dickeya zeae]
MSELLLMASKGIPPASLRIVKLALRLLDRHLRVSGQSLTSSHAVRDMLRLRMAGLEREVFMVFYLDNQNCLLESETVFLGTINQTAVHAREIVKSALHHNAAAVILAHNHPSGCTDPSAADKTITQRLIQALGLVDVRVLDHVIVGHSDILSFAEHGLI